MLALPELFIAAALARSPDFELEGVPKRGSTHVGHLTQGPSDMLIWLDWLTRDASSTSLSGPASSTALLASGAHTVMCTIDQDGDGVDTVVGSVDDGSGLEFRDLSTMAPVGLQLLCDGRNVGDVDGDPTTVSETQVNSAYPTPAGGAIVDGTWDLVRFEVYAPGSADGNVRNERLIVSNGALTSISSDNGGPDEIIGALLTPNGAMLDLDVVCPIATAAQVPYTATPTELWLFDPSEPNLKVYQKQ
jgi:hypothetical protein